MDIGQGEELFDVAPFVLVVDCSESMKSVMSTVNRFVPELIATLRDIPEALESVALGIVSFDEDARIVRRLTWIDEDLTRPQFVAQRRTSYVQPLDRTLELIKHDTPELSDQGFPPVVFFVTDGRPNMETEREWLAARARLLGTHLRPKLVAFGFGDADEATLRRLASDPRLVEFSQRAAQAAMDEILKVVMHTIIRFSTGGVRSTDGSLASRIAAAADLEEEEDTIVYSP